MRALAVITARGGSKGLPRKNLRLLAGKPLVVHAIDAALAARDAFYRVIVSTDDREIAEVSRKAGAGVPFLRPAELATDAAPSLPVVQHAARFIENQDDVRLDWVMLLQPTAPLCTAADIREAIALAAMGGCDSVVSVVEAMESHPFWIKTIEDGLLCPFLPDAPEAVRRQDLEPIVYRRNAAIYITRRDVLFDDDSIYGDRIRPYIMPAERSVDINGENDFRLAQLLMQDREKP